MTDTKPSKKPAKTTRTAAAKSKRAPKISEKPTKVASQAKAKASESVKTTSALALTPATPLAKLATWNKAFAVIFAVQAILVAVLAKAVSVPVNTTYSAVDELATNVAGHEVFAPAMRHLFDVRIAWALAAGLLVFAVGHLLMATVYRKRYELDLEKGVNRWRWADLGMGGGILVTVICMMSGIQQIGLLVAILCTTVLSAGLMLVNERLLLTTGGQKHQVNTLLCALSGVCAAFAWLVLLGGVVGGWMFDGKLPMYLYGLYGSALVLLGAISWATCARLMRRGKWADSLYTERMYMLLGLVIATLIVWQVFVGALM